MQTDNVVEKDCEEKNRKNDSGWQIRYFRGMMFQIQLFTRLFYGQVQKNLLLESLTRITCKKVFLQISQKMDRHLC